MSATNDFWRKVTAAQRAAGTGVSFNPDAGKESSELERVRAKFRGKKIKIVTHNGDSVEALFDGVYLKNGRPKISAIVNGKEEWFSESEVEIIS